MLQCNSVAADNTRLTADSTGRSIGEAFTIRGKPHPEGYGVGREVHGLHARERDPGQEIKTADPALTPEFATVGGHHMGGAARCRFRAVLLATVTSPTVTALPSLVNLLVFGNIR